MTYFKCAARSVSLLTAALFSICLLAAQASAVSFSPWVISGPGTTSVAGSNTSPSFSYAYQRPNYDEVIWTAQATALESGVYNYRWDYSGFHAFFRVTAKLGTLNPAQTLLDVGPSNCCTTPSGGFTYKGGGSFNVAAGDVIGFTFGGDNFDSNNVLRGTLKISAVPVPAAGLMLMTALGAAGIAARRKKSQARA